MPSNPSEKGSSPNNPRGIIGAGLRYQKRVRERLLQNSIGKTRAKEGVEISTSRGRRNASKMTSYNARMQEVLSQMQEEFRKSDESLSEANLEETVKISMRKPPEASFPFIIFGLALIKDLFDVIANLIVIGIPLSMALSLMISLILFFWTLGKMSGGWWKKRLVRWMLTWLVILFLGESTPFLQILPIASIFVLMAHYREKKAVKLFNKLLEQLRSAKLV